MRFIINIGSERSATQVKADPYQDDVKFWSSVHWREARAALRAVGFLIIKHEAILPVHDPEFRVQPDTETTYVVELDVSRIPPGEVYLRLHAVASALHQDCIAVRVFVGDKIRRVLDEQLIGPAADAWKPFNPAYFKELS